MWPEGCASAACGAPNPQAGSRPLRWEPNEGKKGVRDWALRCCPQMPAAGEARLGGWATPPSPSTPPCFHLAAPSASSVVLGHWSPTSGWDNPYLPGSTVWPPLINLGANPPFKPFPAKTRLGRYDSKFCFGHCLLTSVLTVGTLSCLCCWGTRYFFRDGAGSLVIVTLIGDKVQSKN